MEAATIRERSRDLPAEPGVYQFREGDTTLYVGKAVDVRSRVRSYVDPRSRRIARMVDRADELEVAVTDTETQALLLEANLIKRHQPRYNVRLKDDKSYPMVQITDHEAPRIEVTRDPDEAATVFGPFTNRGRVDTVVKALREVFGIRGCSDHKYAGRDRPCLDYEIGLCTAPCTGEIDLESYREDVDSVLRFLGGETGLLVGELEDEMDRAAAEREFERAGHLRDRLEAARGLHGDGSEAIQGRSGERAVDVIGAAVEGETATVARLRAEHGKLVERDRHRLDTPESGSDETEPIPSVLAAFLVQYYAERPLPDAILLPEHHEDPEVGAWLAAEGVAVRVPGAGREATLVDLALKNARQRVGDTQEGALLGDTLGLGRVTRIEGFDVSHAGGDAVVGSNVTFVDGSAQTDGYRRKRLEDTNDDYESMQSLVEWRARRAVEGRDERPDPDLLVIDGGAGQLTAARAALEVVGWDVAAVALAKREERVITPEGEHAWPRDAPHLHLLQRVRDEAHRFAVQYHQTVRDEVSTVLDDVPGIGPETRRRLLGHFGSVENVRQATRAELQSVPGVGPKTAAVLQSRL